MRNLLLITAIALAWLTLSSYADAQVGMNLSQKLSNGGGVSMGTSGYHQAPPAPPPPPPEVHPTGTGVKPYFKADATGVTVDQLTDEQLVAAVNRGIDFLLTHKTKTFWERGNNGVAGSPRQAFDTATILYSLLQVGDAMRDARLQPGAKDIAPALNWLSYLNPPYTDTVALQLSVLALVANRPEYKPAMIRVSNRLVYAVRYDGSYAFWMSTGATGSGWDAPTYPNGLTSNMAMTAVCAAADAGAVVPEKFWTATDQFWRKAENPDGGWCYGMAGAKSPHDHHRPIEDGSPVDVSNLSLSAGGAATLVLVKQHLPNADWSSDKNLPQAAAYLAAHFDPRNPQSLFELAYYRSLGLDSLEMLSQNYGIQRLGEKDVFRETAAALIRSQNADGSWNTPGDQDGTAYAILFLARGHVPIYMDKLSYDGNWNTHPRDAAGHTLVLRDRFERTLAWRVVSIHADLSQWTPAPLLWITGHKDPGFSPEDLAKLRAYVQAGGTILSSPDSNDATFTIAMAKYAQAIGNGISAMRDLPANHPVLSAVQPVANIKLQALSNGQREIWIHCTTDLGALWQNNTTAPKEAIGLAENIYVYLTNKQDLPPPLAHINHAATPVTKGTAQ